MSNIETVIIGEKINGRLVVRLHIRVSTSAQAMVQHGSPEQQKNAALRKIQYQCEQDGFQRIVEIVYETISGKGSAVHKREELSRTKKGIESGTYDEVWIEKLDRLSRDQNTNNDFVKCCHDNGVALYEVESGKVDLRNRGSRMGFNLKNMMAEEYIYDLEEKVTTKQRSARVENGKDTSTCPILGTDPHPTKVGVYIPNKLELKIVADIASQFCLLKSYKETAKYCNEKGYKTKVRLTSEKIDKEGNRLPPRKLGGDNFTSALVKRLLLNSKLRGWGYFKDDWNQFPKLQDDNQMVRWEYAQYREYGSLIEQELLDQVYKVAKDIGKGKRTKESKNGTHALLTGILFGWDGSKFEADFSKEKYKYYRNNQLKVNLRKDEVEKFVIDRIKIYLNESGTLAKVMSATLKNRLVGLPLVEEEIVKAKKELAELEEVINGFSDALRSAALAEDLNVTDVCSEIAKEKVKAERDLTDAIEKLKMLEKKKSEIKSRFENSTAEDWLKRVFKSFDNEGSLKRKRLIQAIIPKVILQKDNTLELRVNPDPEGKINVIDKFSGYPDGGKILGIERKWRERRDSNPRPSA